DEDNLEGWVDEVDKLSEEELENLQGDAGPVKLVLFKTINLTTKLLPAWHQAVKKCSLKPKLLPRDVPTQWNSSTDMLGVAIEYKEAINEMTSDRS
ncbi:hypothetical protein BDN72DRAFT_735145, partial [Pluteus cervinus]